ncbi:MAG: helix-turn-helix transcriptional regulator [Lachnospiraceae bacterium]|nr:helix-turn-helix transcriptional regulator [Lachnospiraceae bacterium]
MDLIKIGRYIAEKRKSLGMTQKQLAEKLNMSDKSVSKWERGVCLPDVSLYAELCEILGISINEFLAGEDLEKERQLQQAEENILEITKDSQKKQKQLKRGISILLILTLALGSVMGMLLYPKEAHQNYLVPVDKEGPQMKTLQMLAGVDGAYLYDYVASEGYSSLKIYVSEYHSGKLMDKQTLELGYQGTEPPQNGSILILPDFEQASVKVILADKCSKLETEIPVLEGVEDWMYYGRSATEIDEQEDIIFGEEQPLVALIYDNDVMAVPDIEFLVKGDTFSFAENDYIYFFTCEFTQ